MITIKHFPMKLGGVLLCGLFLLCITGLVVNESPAKILTSPKGFTTAEGYEPHATIWTEGDQELLDLAASEGWDGAGTTEDPIVISGYSFHATIIQPIRIWDTDLHWIFTGNYITTDGVICGSWFIDTTAGMITNNTFDTCHSGIVLDGCSNLLVENNTITGNTGNGIEGIGTVTNATIRNNIMTDLGADGIVLDTLEDSEVCNNQIDGMVFDGIEVKDGGQDVRIYENSITNVRRGVRFGPGVEGITFEDNTIRNIDTNGITCVGDSSTISDNIFWNAGQQGILFSSLMEHYAEDNVVQGNTFIYCTEYSIEIQGECTGTIITDNDFFDGNESCQVCDDGVDSSIEGNFYDTWISPDVDEDGTVDVPYVISGAAENSDLTPVAAPINAIPNGYTYVPNSNQNVGTGDLPLETIAIVAGIGIVVCVTVVGFVKKR